MTRAGEQPWYVAAFRAQYSRVYAHRDAADAAAAVACCARELALGPAAALLDHCCGAGRHLAGFEREGIPVTGIDLSAELLAEARRMGMRAPLVRGDARALPFADGSFAAVANLFTSFGYFEDERDNEHVLAEIARVLAPGGRVLLDHMNPAWVAANLQPESREERDGLVIDAKRRIREASASSGPRVEKHVDIRLRGPGTAARANSIAYTESVRLYEPDEFDAILARAGLRAVKRLGSFDGAPFGPRSPRQIVIAAKR